MILIDDYCEPQRILTYIEARTIYETEYNELKGLGQLERKRIDEEFQKLKENGRIPMDSDYRDYVMRRLFQLQYYTSEYDYLPILKKEIFLANFLLPDDVTIAELLNKNEITRDYLKHEHLKDVIRFRKIIRDMLIYNNTTITEDFREKLKKYKEAVSILIELFTVEFGVSEPTIILNRICEMLVTCPTYFESKPYNR